MDGELKQKANTHNMLFSIPKLIAFCSRVMTLEAGDIILTGTPAGVRNALHQCASTQRVAPLPRDSCT